MVGGSSTSSVHSAPAGVGRLLPWLLASLALHAWWLAPEPLPALRAPGPALQWRLLASAPAVTTPAAADAPAASTARGAKAVASGARAASQALPSASAAEQTPALLWPPSAAWNYRLSWQGEEGQARLDWSLDGQRYLLRLQRRLPARALPTWQSQGMVGSAGLVPEQFSVQRESGRRQRKDLVPEAGAQDRLSWMLQATALARSLSALPGQRLELEVGGWHGGVQRWVLLVERDEQRPELLRLRRLPPSSAPGLEQLLWLDPSRGHLPVRLRLRYEDTERWELNLEADGALPSTPVQR